MSVCAKWTQRGPGWTPRVGWECQFADVVLPMVASIMIVHGELSRREIWAWMERDGVNLADATAVYGWLGIEQMVDGILGFQVTHLFRHLHLVITNDDTWGPQYRLPRPKRHPISQLDIS